MIVTLLKPPPGDGDTPKDSFSESLSVITGQFYLWSKGKKSPLQKQIYFWELNTYHIDKYIVSIFGTTSGISFVAVSHKTSGRMDA